MGYSSAIVFIAYIVFNYLCGTIFTQSSNAYWIVAVILGILSMITMFVGYKYSDISGGAFILFAILLALGYTFNSMNIGKLKNASDTNFENYKTKTLVSTSSFLFFGIFAYTINGYESDCHNRPEFLCNADMILLLLLANISIYQLIIYLREIKAFSKKTKNSSNTSTPELFNILIISLWQLYIYFLSDGFTNGRIAKQIGSGDPANMYEIFSSLSIFIIIGFLYFTIHLSNECESSEKIENIKEVTYNMIGTTITIIIILILYNTGKLDVILDK
tara:strand:- start:268 stop:1092 length:825 start_codon:yes stop_codon:yes gene_type:complete